MRTEAYDFSISSSTSQSLRTLSSRSDILQNNGKREKQNQELELEESRKRNNKHQNPGTKAKEVENKREMETTTLSIDAILIDNYSARYSPQQELEMRTKTDSRIRDPIFGFVIIQLNTRTKKTRSCDSNSTRNVRTIDVQGRTLYDV
jgi:hypothetical protein